METIIIGLIVGVSIFYLVKRTRSTMSVKNESPCGCGCSGCNSLSLEQGTCEHRSPPAFDKTGQLKIQNTKSEIPRFKNQQDRRNNSK